MDYIFCTIEREKIRNYFVVNWGEGGGSIKCLMLFFFSTK